MKVKMTTAAVPRHCNLQEIASHGIVTGIDIDHSRKKKVGICRQHLDHLVGY